MESEDTLAHFGVPGMRWGQRKTPDDLAYEDRKKAKKQGAIMGGVIGGFGAITLVELMAKNNPPPKKLKGLAYVKNLFKKTPPVVVPNPQKLNTANIAFRALSKSKYGKAVAALGGFAVAASLGSKISASNFDKDYNNPNRATQKQENTLAAQAIVDSMDTYTRNKLKGASTNA